MSRPATIGRFPSSPPATDDDRDMSPEMEATDARTQQCEDDLTEKHQGTRLANISPGVVRQTVTPFLRDHVPDAYAPVFKIEASDTSQSVARTTANSKFCYRHAPNSKCRKAADEIKMVALQSELENLPASDQEGINHFWSLYSASPSKLRELMLKGILAQSCFPQLSLVAREVQSQLKIDFVSALPVELALRVLSFLDTTSLCKAAQVSQQWRIMADDDFVWHRMCEQHIDRKCTLCGWGLPLLMAKKLRDWRRKPNRRGLGSAESRYGGQTSLTALPRLPSPEVPRSPRSPKRASSYFDDANLGNKRQCSKRIVPTASDVLTRAWKDVYRDRFKIGTNWKYSRFSLKVFKGHDNGVTSLALFDDKIMATGSYDNSIHIWDITSGQKLRTLTGHTGGIRSIQMDDHKLVSASLDNTVKLWNWRTGECLRTLSSHAGPAVSVHFDQDVFASGSADTTVRVYNFATKDAFCLRHHQDWVNQVKVDMTSRTLLSASDDTTICLWDLDTKQVIRQFQGHVGHTQQILALPLDFEPDDDAQVTGIVDETEALSVASGRSSPPVLSQQASSATNQLCSDAELRACYGAGFIDDPSRPLPNRYILSGGLDAAVKLWDTATGKCVRNQFGHLEGIWSLEADALRIVTGSNDKTVKTWDPRSGRCTGTFTGHMGPVTCVGVSDSLMASGSEDGEVRLYDFRYQCEGSDTPAALA